MGGRSPEDVDSSGIQNQSLLTHVGHRIQPPLCNMRKRPAPCCSQGPNHSIIQALQADVAKINTDGDTSDYTAMASNCTQLGSDVIAAQKLGPIPDDSTQQEWSSALDDLSTGASECLTGAQNNPNSLTQGVGLTFAYGTLDQGRSELAIVAAAVNGQT
jgi:hypothetical protein